MLKLGQQNDAFLFVRVGPGDDGRAGLWPRVEGQVGGVGGDVDQVARLGLAQEMQSALQGGLDIGQFGR